jgi:hypothetical protein
VRAHDPAVSALPADLADAVELCSTPLRAASEADVLVVCTAWPDYLEVPVEELIAALALAQIVDPAGVLRSGLVPWPEVHHVRVGFDLHERARSGTMLVGAPRPLAAGEARL